MNKSAIIKNERASKLKQKHMKSILSEVKNKSIIEDLENNYHLKSDFNILNYKPNWKLLENNTLITTRPIRSSRNSKFKNNQNKQLTSINAVVEGKENLNRSKQVDASLIIDEKPQFQNKQPQKQKKSKLQREGSRIELQLQQIMEYSQLYPSRNASNKSLEKKISKIDNFVSRDMRNTTNLHPNRDENYNHLSENGIFTPNASKSRFYSGTTKKFATSKGIFDENVMLQIIDYNANIADHQEDKLKRKQAKQLIKKSKNTLGTSTPKQFDYSLTSFLQHEMNQLRMKAGRKTVGSHSKNPSSCQLTDLRGENIRDLQRFIRGEAKEDEQYSSFVASKQIKKFENKYQLFDGICKKIKEEFNNQKLDLNGMTQLSVKNAVFLIEAYRQNNNWSRRMQIQKAMKRLHLYL